MFFGWVNDDRMLIFVLTIPLRFSNILDIDIKHMKISFEPQTLWVNVITLISRELIFLKKAFVLTSN